jgi:hypothetical protein
LKSFHNVNTDSAADRLQLNAAIDRLIDTEGGDEKARHIVFEWGLRLQSVRRVRGAMQLETPGDSFTGFTAEQGDVSVSDGKDQVRTVEFGGEQTRVGAYKLWREKGRYGWKIFIAHFWKLDESTQSETEEAPVWCLACSDSGPLWFGHRGKRPLFRILALMVARYYMVETWGPFLGKEHPAGLSIQLTLGMD